MIRYYCDRCGCELVPEPEYPNIIKQIGRTSLAKYYFCDNCMEAFKEWKGD